MKSKIHLCAISSISSGDCSEDCKFCTQSIKNNINIEKYQKKPIKLILEEAKMASKNGACGFCLVSSGKSLTKKKLEFIEEIIVEVKKNVPNLLIIVCAGLSSLDKLIKLKNIGVEAYNHNLETSKEYYDKICLTHSWQERFDTCLNVKKSGLKLICGGIFGLGESSKDRESLFKTISALQPYSVPLNFYIPNKGLPIKSNNLSIDESLDIIKLAKTYIKDANIMVAGGREVMFKDRQKEIFKAGANSIIIGNYLTTNGQAIEDDLLLIN